VLCHSLHWIADARFREAIADFLAREARAVEEEVEVLTSFGPFRREAREEQD
jgi:predicted N-acyltransferase